jgi:hypothetical protein
MEIVAYGTKGAVANSHELCTWIEYVPGYTMFGSCDAVSSVSNGHPVNVGLEAQITNPKLGQSTEVGGRSPQTSLRSNCAFGATTGRRPPSCR